MPLTPKRVLRQFRYAMYFDGLKSYVDLGVRDSLRLITGAVTVMAWAMPTKLNVDQKIFGVQDNVAGGYKLGVYTNNKVEFEIRDSSNRIYLNREVTGGTVLTTNVWYHFTGLYNDSADYLATYVNASLDRPMTTTGVLAPTNGRAIVGRDPYSNYGYWNGYIAQVLVYSRDLSDSERRRNYQNPDNPVRNGLVLWLQADPAYVKDIDGDGVLEWIDLSGFNNHGKIYGAQLVQLIKTHSRVLKPVRILKPLR